MDQARLQAKIARGLAKAAAIVGGDYVLYRPVDSGDPLVPANIVGTVRGAIDAEQALALSGPTPPGKPFGLLIADPEQLRFGDYLVGEDIYFVSRIQALEPAWCVLCNARFNVLDTAQPTAAGTNSYGGVTSAGNISVATAWPMSMSARTRGGEDITKLPSDTRSSFFEVLSPAIPGLTLGLGLCLQDPNSQNYTVMSSERTAYGLKLLVGIATT